VARHSSLCDEHIAKAAGVGLPARGVDAATVAEAGQLGTSDAELMAFARAQLPPKKLEWQVACPGYVWAVGASCLSPDMAASVRSHEIVDRWMV
jgi:hypothetical protein